MKAWIYWLVLAVATDAIVTGLSLAYAAVLLAMWVMGSLGVRP